MQFIYKPPQATLDRFVHPGLPYTVPFVYVVSLTQAVGRLAVPVSLAVVAVTAVTGAHHAAKVVGALLLTGGAGAHVVL